jgi:membrane protease YdiL (CAAX protease family)
LGRLVPAVSSPIMFGLWHICPQAVLKNKLPGGVISFVAYAMVLGLTYSLAASQTGSIFWPAVSHGIHDALGLGGFAYSAWLVKPRPTNTQPIPGGR